MKEHLKLFQETLFTRQLKCYLSRDFPFSRVDIQKKAVRNFWATLSNMYQCLNILGCIFPLISVFCSYDPMPGTNILNRDPLKNHKFISDLVQLIKFPGVFFISIVRCKLLKAKHTQSSSNQLLGLYCSLSLCLLDMQKQHARS